MYGLCNFPFYLDFCLPCFSFWFGNDLASKPAELFSYPELEEDQSIDRNMSLNIVNTVQQ